MFEPRFIFPGFACTARQDTPTHEVDVGTIEEGGHTLVLTMIRNNQYPNLNFLVSKVSTAVGAKLWDFQKEQFEGIGMLAKADDQTVIALRERGMNGKLARIIPLNSLVGVKTDLRKLVELKRAAALFLGCDYLQTTTEKKLADFDRNQQRLAQEAASAADREAKERAREEFVRMILARGKVVAYTAAGKARTGIPVTESEWPRLSHGVYVVLVSSIDSGGTVGTPIEAFQVVKERGKNPSKGFAVPVTADRPTTSPVVTPVASRDIAVVDMPEGAFEVLIFPAMEEIRAARAAGLNGGTLAGVSLSAEKMEVYAVHHDRIDTLGHFARIA